MISKHIALACDRGPTTRPPSHKPRQPAAEHSSVALYTIICKWMVIENSHDHRQSSLSSDDACHFIIPYSLPKTHTAPSKHQRSIQPSWPPSDFRPPLSILCHAARTFINSFAGHTIKVGTGWSRTSKNKETQCCLSCHWVFSSRLPPTA